MKKESYFGPEYATHPDGRLCHIRVTYNHSTRPEFVSLIYFPGHARPAMYSGHPRRYGVTQKEGWVIHPEWTGGW